MKIVSYNIRKAVGLDGRRHPERIVQVLNRLDADIVILQEADKRLGPRPSALPLGLIDRETQYHIADLAETDVSLGWHGNAILLRKGLEASRARRLPLPGLEPRGAVMATIEAGGTSLHVVGVHLALIRRWRRRQLRRIVQHVEPDLRPRTLLAGDFNEWSPGSGLEPLMPAFSVVSPGRSFPSAVPVAPLDRFAHGAGLQITRSGVDLSASARIASDHLPVWAEIAPA